MKPNHMVNANKYSLSGAYDLHVHTAPSIFPRSIRDDELARQYKEQELNGFTLKNHHDPTAARASLLNRKHGIEVYGSVVLNHAVGGLNPHAVATQLELGARFLWFPTVDAEAHIQAFGGQGGYSKMKPSQTPLEAPPLSILQDGELKEEVRTIVDLAKQYHAVIGSGHLSQEEVIVLRDYCRAERAFPFVITHPLFTVPNFSPEEVQSLIDEGIFVETTSLQYWWNSSTIRDMLTTIHKVGEEKCFLVSDGGQKDNPQPYQMFVEFLEVLIQNGLLESSIEKLVKETPERILHYHA